MIGRDWLLYLSLKSNLIWSAFFISMSVCLSVYLSVCLSVSLSVYLCQSVCLSVCSSVCLYVCLFVSLSVYLSVCLSVYQSISLSVCLPVCLFVYCHWFLSSQVTEHLQTALVDASKDVSVITFHSFENVGQQPIFTHVSK